MLADGNPAPGRRIALPFDDLAADVLTADGATLFDAAIAWAVNDNAL